MPATHVGGVGSAPRIPVLKRAAILTLNWHANMSSSEVAAKLDLKKSTVEDILRKSKARAADPEDFDDVLGCLESCYGCGIPEKYPEGSAKSIALRDISQKDEEHWQRTFPEIAHELEIPAARSTLEQIFHSQHNIFRRKPAHKPSLSADQMEAGLAFAHMALHIAINTIAFTDEMWVEFNKPRRQRNVSRYQGIEANEYALHDNDQERQPIRVMFWGAIMNGNKGPYHIWESDSAEEKENYQQIVNEDNRIKCERQQFNQQQAQLPGTSQYEVLEVFNDNIELLNEKEGRIGRHKRKRRQPEQMFREPKLEFTSKGGINWVSYRERVLRPKLYPWMASLRERLGVPTLYLVEDNAPSHQTARRVDEKERKTYGIVILKWPSKSPDLNQIESIWSYQKDEISTWNFIGASRQAMNGAKDILVRTWEELPQEVIDNKCQTFYEKLQRVILHCGNNNFNG